jgi:hypothetical protein
MPPLYRVSSHVDAPPETVWAVLLDKMEHPQRYMDDALDSDILVRGQHSVVRELVLPGGVTFRERIAADFATRTITYTLLDHPVYEGSVVNELKSAVNGGVDLAFELDWKVRPGCVADRDPDEALALIRSSMDHTKRIAEALEKER